mgnify:CR=1 FL=1
MLKKHKLAEQFFIKGKVDSVSAVNTKLIKIIYCLTLCWSIDTTTHNTGI